MTKHRFTAANKIQITNQHQPFGYSKMSQKQGKWWVQDALESGQTLIFLAKQTCVSYVFIQSMNCECKSLIDHCFSQKILCHDYSSSHTVREFSTHLPHNPKLTPCVTSRILKTIQYFTWTLFLTPAEAFEQYKRHVSDITPADATKLFNDWSIRIETISILK